jgi:phosphohistidine phosphatase
MELILWRHAEAENGVPDNARQLTAKGLRQARDMGGWLKARLPEKTRCIVSPATRTQQTAGALDIAFETVGEIGPGASPRTILAAAGWPGAKEAVLVVGHQPTLGETAALLMSGEPFEWNIRKGAIWWFRHKNREGVSQVILRASISPDML